MGTVIKNNMSAVRTLNILNKNNAALQSTMLKVSSGQKINTGGDDAAGLIISEKMRNRIRSDEQANRNVQTGLSLLRVTEGALGNITEILHTMKEKTLQAGVNAASGTADVTAITKELQALAGQIDEIALNTKFNGRALITGSKDISLQIGPESGAWLKVLSGGLSISASKIGLSNIGSTTLVGSTSYASFLGKIDSALDSILDIQGDVAKVQSRLGYQSDNLTSEAENLQAAESVIRDSDMTKEMANFMKWNVLSQASQLMLAQAGQNAYSVLNLLQA